MTGRAASIGALAELVESASGNVVPPGHYPFLADLASRRAQATGYPDLDAYVHALGRGQLSGEWAALLPHITVKESFCFRTPQHFARLADTILPELVARRARSRRLAVWSAGCARGEEPATLAMVLAQAPELAGWDWRILATDVDQDALEMARSGLLSERAVAGVPLPLVERYLAARGSSFELDPLLRRHIQYEVQNLVAEPFPAPGGAFDLVFLRNVLIYFRVESQRRVVAGMARALAEDGVLFVGPSETLWQLSDELVPEDLGDCFCYRRRKTSPPRERGRGNAAAVTAALARKPGGDGPAHLAPPSRAKPGPKRSGPPSPPSVQPASPPAEVEAHRTPRPTTGERIECAARMLADNQVETAASLLAQALQDDPTNAAARALLGILHDLTGKPERALAAFRAALYLQPQLFQVRLLLADALRRAGHHERARGEYRQLLAALASGRARPMPELPGLLLPDAATAQTRARRVLQRTDPRE